MNGRKEKRDMTSKTVIKSRLDTKTAQLKAANEAYTALLTGQVKSYTIGSRNLTKFDLPQLEETIKKLENEVDSLEHQLQGGKKRRAVAVVPRDF